MTTGVFIVLRWVLTFGVPLAVAAHQLVLLRKAKVEADERRLTAVAVPAE